jgi:hypothetical protein
VFAFVRWLHLAAFCHHNLCSAVHLNSLKLATTIRCHTLHIMYLYRFLPLLLVANMVPVHVAATATSTAATSKVLRGGHDNNFFDRDLKTGPKRQSKLCSSNPTCVASGNSLEGDCCPTTEGVFLDCCDDDGDGRVHSKKHDTVHDTDTTAASCSTNAACTDLGLTGSCCPTPEGVILNCCNIK